MMDDETANLFRHPKLNMRASIAHIKCNKCGRLFRDHSTEETIDHVDVKIRFEHRLVPGESRTWSPEWRESVASFECKICNRVFREHSTQEFDDCMARIEAPTVRLFPKGKRAKKEDLAHGTCEICGRRFGDHSQQEYDACINQNMKRHKPKKEDLVYVKCEICGHQFGNHSSQQFDACVDQIIENSV